MAAILLCAWIALVIRSPQIAAEAARQSCKVWSVSVMPTLFPFLALSLMLVSRLDVGGKQGRSAMHALALLGMLGGSPSGARLLSQYAERSRVSQRNIQRCAACVTTASPMFILGTLTGWLGGNAADGYRMLAAHIIAALLAAIACSAWTRGWSNDPADGASGNQTEPHALGFGEAVTQAASAMLNVCGCMVLFNVLLACLTDMIPMSGAAAAWLACLLEMAGGCARSAALGLPKPETAAIMCAAATFGGMSVFMQNAAFLSKTPARAPIQFAARIVAGAAAYCLCRALFGEWLYALAAAALVFITCVVSIPQTPARQRVSFSSLRLLRSTSAISIALSSTCLSIASQWSRFIR